ncbi:hypothetical protein ScPMuIL_002360 [Solemya velum]
MARYFNQSDIDLFKECFFFHARRGYIKDEEELTLIMRSLAYSPTRTEITAYFGKHGKAEGRIDFASFLDTMHDHCQVENVQREITAGFEAHDNYKRGYVSGPEVKHILMNMGEKLNKHEVDRLFHDAHVQPHGQIQYQDFVHTLVTPMPDY